MMPGKRGTSGMMINIVPPVTISSGGFFEIPTVNNTDWTYAGVPGGIPNRTTVATTITTSWTQTDIDNAIATCPSCQVVQFAAGTYTDKGFTLRADSVTVRGAGTNQTIFTSTIDNGTGVAFGNGANIDDGRPITGASKGSFTFTSTTTTGLGVGTMVEVSCLDDSDLIVDNGGLGGSGRNLRQLNSITAISSNSITCRNPWFYDFSTRSPTLTRYYNDFTFNSGVENMTFDYQGAGGNHITSNFTDSCWLKNVESRNCTGYHSLWLATLNLEIRQCYIHDGGTGPNNSGINMFGNYIYGCNSNWRLETNIFNKTFPAVEVNASSNGGAVLYNYSFGNSEASITWTLDDGHAPFNAMNLYEGNIAPQWGMDAFFGGAGLGTLFRNYIAGYDPRTATSAAAIWLLRLGYYYTIAGNVLGSSNQIYSPGSYQDYCATAGDAIYWFGYPNLGNCDLTNATPDAPFYPPGADSSHPDPKVAATVCRWANYDFFNLTTRFVTAELNGRAAARTTLHPSIAYSSKPAWWTAGSIPSSIPWPPIGPDITGGNYGDASGHIYKIPAQVCWETQGLSSGGTYNSTAFYG